jgi:hypothetical protein
MMSFLSISFSASAAGRAFIWRGARTTKCLLLKQSTASDMSDLSYEQELGEVCEGGEVDEGPLQHQKINYLASRLTRECPSLPTATP